jgi:adenine deaminase
MLRHGSIRADLDALISLVTEEPKVDTRKVMFTPDWKKPSDIIKEGYVDNLVCSAIQRGVSPVEAIQMATLNPAAYLGLDRWHGSIAPGRRADILLADDVYRPTPRTVIADGQIVVLDGRVVFKGPPMTPADKKIPWLTHRLIPSSIDASDFFVETGVHSAYVKVPSISILDKTITERADLNLPVIGKQIRIPAENDVLKISMLNKENSGFVTAFVTGFGAKLGGLATSISHERHMPLVIGNREKDMVAALRRLREIGGGMTLVHNGQVKEEIPLVLGGIMSDRPLEELSVQMQSMNNTLRTMGSQLEDPLFTLGFLSFSALPWIRITPSGLLDVKSQSIIW